MVNLGDGQIIAGLAFLISGITQLYNGLDVYHWITVTRIVWFSSATHLAMLSCLSGYLYRYQWKRNVRLFLMVCMAAFYMAASIPTGWEGYSFDSPARCLYHLQPKHEYRDLDPAFSSVFLGINIFIRIYKSFRTLTSWGNKGKEKFARQSRRLFEWLENRLNNNKKRGLFLSMSLVQPLMALYLVADLYLYLFSSMLIEVRGAALFLMPLQMIDL